MKNNIKNFFLYGSLIIYIAAIILTSTSFVGQVHWFLDIWSHFIIQVLIVGILSAVTFTLVSRQPIALLLLFPIIILFFIFDPYTFFVSNNLRVSNSSTNDIYYINLNYFNEDTDQIIKQITELKAETVVIVELNESLNDKLHEMYANRITHTDAASSCGIYSNQSFIGEIIVNTKYPICTAEFAEYTLFAVHPFPPLSGELWAKQRSHFSEIQKLLENESPHFINRTVKDVVVVGDFNSTIYSPIFRKPLGEYHKTNIYSWNTNSILSIPIDHALSNSLELTIHKLPTVSSDHNGLYIEVGK